MGISTYVLASSGPCPDILLVQHGSLLTPVPQEIVQASQALVANHSYHVHGQTSAAIDLALPPCTAPSDRIILDVAAGNAPIKIADGTTTVWSTTAPNPQSVVVLECNGTAWEVVA